MADLRKEYEVIVSTLKHEHALAIEDLTNDMKEAHADETFDSLRSKDQAWEGVIAQRLQETKTEALADLARAVEEERMRGQASAETVKEEHRKEIEQVIEQAITERDMMSNEALTAQATQASEREETTRAEHHHIIEMLHRAHDAKVAEMEAEHGRNMRMVSAERESLMLSKEAADAAHAKLQVTHIVRLDLNRLVDFCIVITS